MGSNLGGAAAADPKLTRHFKDLFPTLGALEVAADAARQLQGHPGWNVLLDLLAAEIATVDAALDGGQPLKVCDDAARVAVEFAHLHGRRGGLRAPGVVLEALVRFAESELAKQRAKHEGGAESSPQEEA